MSIEELKENIEKQLKKTTRDAIFTFKVSRRAIPDEMIPLLVDMYDYISFVDLDGEEVVVKDVWANTRK